MKLFIISLLTLSSVGLAMELDDCLKKLVGDSNYLSRINWLKSDHPLALSRPTVCMLPGGPGLSSYTLLGAANLAANFNLVFIDPPGTGGTNELAEITFENTIQDIEKALATIRGPIILIGHSFGGIYAANLAKRRRLDVAGVVLVATPTTRKSWDGIVVQYERLKTPILETLATRFSQSPSNACFSEYLGAYGRLYFLEHDTESAGAWLSRDQVSSISHQKLIREWKPTEDLVAGLRKNEYPVLFVAGEEDLLVTANLVQDEANAAQRDFQVVPGAAHFIMRDRPEDFAAVIEKFFLAPRMEK